MREKRLNKFRKNRHRRLGKIILLAFVMPFVVAILGYLVATLIILPSM
jgi:hypothetical protein